MVSSTSPLGLVGSSPSRPRSKAEDAVAASVLAGSPIRIPSAASRNDVSVPAATWTDVLQAAALKNDEDPKNMVRVVVEGTLILGRGWGEAPEDGGGGSDVVGGGSGGGSDVVGGGGGIVRASTSVDGVDTRLDGENMAPLPVYLLNVEVRGKVIIELEEEFPHPSRPDGIAAPSEPNPNEPNTPSSAPQPPFSPPPSSTPADILQEVTGTTLTSPAKQRSPRLQDRVYGFQSPYQSPRRAGEMATEVVRSVLAKVNSQAQLARENLNKERGKTSTDWDGRGTMMDTRLVDCDMGVLTTNSPQDELDSNKKPDPLDPTAHRTRYPYKEWSWAPSPNPRAGGHRARSLQACAHKDKLRAERPHPTLMNLQLEIIGVWAARGPFGLFDYNLPRKVIVWKGADFFPKKWQNVLKILAPMKTLDQGIYSFKMFRRPDLRLGGFAKGTPDVGRSAAGLARREDGMDVHLYERSSTCAEDLDLMAERVARFPTVRITFSSLQYLQKMLRWLASASRMPER